MKKVIAALFTALYLAIMSPANAGGIVSITFDDATISQYQHGLRIAKKYNVPGTLYVVTQAVGNHNPAPGAYNSDMSWNHVREFRAAGWEIGSHTHTHPDMTDVSPEVVTRELATAKKLIEQEVGVTPITYASPYGRFNEAVIAEVQKFYPYHLRAWDGNRGRNDLKNLNPLDIGRQDVAFDTTVEYVCDAMREASITGKWLVLIFHRIVDKEKPAEYEVSVKAFEKMMHCARVLEDRGVVQLKTIADAIKGVSHVIQ